MMLRKPWLLVAASIYVLAALPAAAEPAIDGQWAKEILESCTASQFVPASGIDLSRDLLVGDTILIDCPALGRRRGYDDGTIEFEVIKESDSRKGARPTIGNFSGDEIFRCSSGSGWRANLAYREPPESWSRNRIIVDFYSGDNGRFMRELALDGHRDSGSGYTYHEGERRFDKPRMSAGARGNPVYLQVLSEVRYTEHSTYTETDGSTVHVLSQNYKNCSSCEEPKTLVIGESFGKENIYSGAVGDWKLSMLLLRELKGAKGAYCSDSDGHKVWWTPEGDPRTLCCLLTDGDLIGVRAGYDEIQGTTGRAQLFLLDNGLYYYLWLSENGEYGFVSYGAIDDYGELQEPELYIECECFENDDDDFMMLPKKLTLFAGPAFSGSLEDYEDVDWGWYLSYSGQDLFRW